MKNYDAWFQKFLALHTCIKLEESYLKLVIANHCKMEQDKKANGQWHLASELHRISCQIFRIIRIRSFPNTIFSITFEYVFFYNRLSIILPVLFGYQKGFTVHINLKCLM